ICVSSSYFPSLFFETELSFRRGLNEFFAACTRPVVSVVSVIYNSTRLAASCILGGDGVSCRRRHEFGTDRIGDRIPQNLIDRRERIRVEVPVEGARHSFQFCRMPRAPQRRGDSGLV